VDVIDGLMPSRRPTLRLRRYGIARDPQVKREKKGVVKDSDDVMAALALVRPRWAAGSEQAIPVRPCRTFPDIRAVSAAAIGPPFLCQTPASTRKKAIPRESE
jgi:hypothetical protein